MLIDNAHPSTYNECMPYIDFHSHLVPCVDDGAKSLQEALSLLREMKEAHDIVTAVVTPHFNSDYLVCKGIYCTMEQMLAAIEELKAAVAESPERYPELLFGCEYFLDIRHQDAVGELLTLAGTDIVLLEMPYEIDLDGVQKTVRLVQDAGYRVLLAHPEKYDAFILEPVESFSWLHEHPEVLVQTETWNLYNKEPLAWRFIEEGLTTVLGTDAHSYHRYPSYMHAVIELQEWAGDDFAKLKYIEDITYNNPMKLLGNR